MGEMEEKGGPLKNSVLFVLRSLFVLPLDSFIFLAPLALSGYSSQPNERALFPSVARISLIRGTYVRPRPREAILIGSPPQTQLLSRKCCNTDGLTAAEFKMPTNERTSSPR